MTKYITKAQREELEDASAFGVEETHDLLKKYAGIEARPYTAYLYFDENGDFLACSDETDVDELLKKAYVEVRDDGPT